MLLVISFFLARRKPQLALWLAAIALMGSIVVGILGTYFHFVRAIRPFAASGERMSIDLLVWGAPVFAPPTFVLVGILGFVAMVKTEMHTGAYGSGLPVRLPFSKDQIYYVLASLGILIARSAACLIIYGADLRIHGSGCLPLADCWAWSRRWCWQYSNIPSAVI